MPSQKAPPAIYRLRITLVGIEPLIWRVIQVPGTILLCCLHDALQAELGWSDSHLHQFEKDGKYWGVPEYDEFEERDDPRWGLRADFWPDNGPEGTRFYRIHYRAEMKSVGRINNDYIHVP